MIFEIGKTYQHTTGKRMTIIGRLKTHIYGVCLIGEDDMGELRPVGEEEENAINWYEVEKMTREEGIKALEQEPKMGQWIIYNYPGHECVYCSSCKEEYYEDDLYMGGSDFPKYCPNCGCRMVEPQESEET